MKFLRCLFCEGELDVVGQDGYRKIVKCRECNVDTGQSKKAPEIFVIKKIIRNP